MIQVPLRRAAEVPREAVADHIQHNQHLEVEDMLLHLVVGRLTMNSRPHQIHMPVLRSHAFFCLLPMKVVLGRAALAVVRQGRLVD